MLGEKKRIVTGDNWKEQPRDDLRIFTNRVTKAGYELKDVAYLDVDGGDITAYIFHRDAAHQVHAEGHCDKPAWAKQETPDGPYLCSCGKEVTLEGADHDFCLKAIVI